MKSYFGAGKVCLYIDQFAASNLFDEQPNALWAEIATLIEARFAEGKLICPVPTEHFLESANKTQERAAKVDRKLHELGQGLAFLPEAAITANYMIALLRHQPINQDTFCIPLKHQATISRDGAFAGFKAQHQDLNAKVTEAAAGANDLRTILAEKRFPRSVMEPMYLASRWMQVLPFKDRLTELLTVGHLISRGVEFESGPVIDWVDLVFQLLLWQHKMNTAEAVELLKIVTETGFDQIPPLDIRISLTANLAIEHKKETINDQIDIMRLATGLPAADLVFTDKQRKFELEQTGLAKKYQAEIFSGTTVDLQLLIERLRTFS
ncbi:hypothetical protein KHS38_12915 [Mucilaginibacter sp. Bleaf8]|uniref:hypothetical protein n=1 Tax=Mucilaginibacter sp. Bleaf8 TaxID=2834430 RepID=UPI001BCF78F5|nr:hypothetical protein [Mucilaginibacter sp. Bleaf8]MBS7565307.1 hypothetical protein [Mucilaginibacter sp. Bleaf8]